MVAKCGHLFTIKDLLWSVRGQVPPRTARDGFPHFPGCIILPIAFLTCLGPFPDQGPLEFCCCSQHMQQEPRGRVLLVGIEALGDRDEPKSCSPPERRYCLGNPPGNGQADLASTPGGNRISLPWHQALNGLGRAD